MPVAFNQQTGQALRLDNGQWVPTQIARNKAGNTLAYDGQSWVPATGQAASAPQEGSFAQRFLGGMATPGMGAARLNESLGETEGNMDAGAIGEQPDMPTPDQQTAAIKDVAAQINAAKPKTGTDWAGLLGQMLAPQNLVMGATGGGGVLSRILSGVLTGAASGATSTAGEGGSAGQIATGAALGAGAGGALGSLAGVTGASVSPEVRTLADHGVVMTPGQLAGGELRDVEDKASSWPLVGPIIKNAQRQGQLQFDRGAADETLSYIGQKVDPQATGHALISDVNTKIGAAYDNAIPKQGVTLDQDFLDDVTNKMAPRLINMGPDQAKQFDNIVTDIFTRADKTGTLTPDQFKIVDSDLRTQIQTLISNGSTASEKELGRALVQVKQSLQENLTRQDPEAGAALTAANNAWAHFVQLRNAAVQDVKNRGEFTPENLLTAEKTLDKSAGKGRFAEGKMPMQQLAEAGQAVLPSTVPDDGTAGRLLMAGALGTAATAPHLLGSYLPAALGMAGIYSQPVLRLLNHIALNAPGRTPFANALSATAPMLSGPFGSLAGGQQ